MIKQSKPSGQMKEATNLVGVGIKFQEMKEYNKSKLAIQQGIDKIKKVLIGDNSSDKETIFEYVNHLFIVISISIVFLKSFFKM